MEPIPEAVAWSRRADQWAQQANLPATTADQNGQWQSVSRWSEVVPTTRSGYPADGVGWRTETAEWQATTETARWRQTTEWRSTSGTHGWRSTTEAWQTGSAGAAGLPPQVAPPATGQRAISSTAWQSPGADDPTGGPDIRQAPADNGNGAPDASASPNAPWQQSADTRPAWQQFATPSPPWQPGASAPWQQPTTTPRWEQGSPATPPWEQAAPAGPPWDQGAASTPPWQQGSDRPAPSTPAWQQLVEPGPSWQQPREDPPGRREPHSGGWSRADGTPVRDPDSTASWQRADATPSWQEPGSAPGRQSAGAAPGWTAPAEPTASPGSWSRPAPYDSGRHLVRDDDRERWRRESAAGATGLADQSGRRRTPEGGTGWSTRSEADNWAGHTDTGTMPAFTDPGQSTSRGWRTDPEQSTSRGWSTNQEPWSGADPEQSSSRLRRAEPERPPSRSRRAEPEPEAPSWRADLATPDRRFEDDDWRRDPDTGQWSRFEDDDSVGGRDREPRERRPRRDPGPPSDPWADGAAETSVIPLPWQPQESRADGRRPAPDATRRGYEYEPDPSNDQRGYATELPSRRRGYGPAAPAEGRGYEPEPDDRPGWRDEPRRGTRAGEWRDESLRASRTGEWRDEPRREARTGEWRDEPRGGRRRAGDDDDDDDRRAADSGGTDTPLDPEAWRRDAEPNPERDNWRMTRLEDAPTQAWRQELQAELRAEQRPSPGDAATEIRGMNPGPASTGGWEQPGRGAASYRDGSTGDWRRELAAQGGADVTQPRRSSQNPPGPTAGKASVPVARPGAARLTDNGGGGQAGTPARAESREPMLVGARSGGRWQDPPDTQWPPRPATGYESAATGSYERRAVGGLAAVSERRQTNLLEPDEDEIEEDTGGPLAAVGYTVVWYGVPVVLFVLAMLVLNGSQQAHAFGTLLNAAPQFALSLVLSMGVAVGLRRASGSWKAASVGLAAAVVGGGVATVLTSAITGNSLS
ncbi:hypothetical protein EV385_2842 [Krasilnikovia cinnamomea]|uniref:Uncharacterized protein n=1 Tax=Krasilnikovia cinnamomea TaxID=349313 RepID=A0A4Q7ZKG9_9ACTN|nr:hypothetical protein [Krasilnikovia cinnamomea]RZU51044.1 hypothetical protein EV385_2842 [Krasilnikovia cinnamomea]